MKKTYLRKSFIFTSLLSLNLIPTLSHAGENVSYDGTDTSLLHTVNVVPNSLAPQDLNNVDGNRITANVVSGGTNIGGDLYGAFSAGAANITNNTVNLMAGTIARSMYGGFSAGSGNITGNTVNMNGGTVGGDVHGGASSGVGTGNVTNNTVNINGGMVNGNMGGGIAFGSSSAIGNTVNLSGGTINGAVWGANAPNAGDVMNNIVNMSGGTVNNTVWGGVSFGTGNAMNNTVSLSGGAVTNNVIGGQTNGSGKNISNNTVNISGGTITNAVTGAAGGGSANTFNNNSVKISSGTIGGTVNGAMSNGSDSTLNSNTINISGGTVGRTVNGASATLGSNNTLSDNTVNISGGAIGNNVFGAIGAANSTANNNTVNMSGGTVNGGLTGARGGSGSTVSNNTVNLNDGTVGTSVFGGINDSSGTASNNTVNLRRGTVNQDVYGGFGGTNSNVTNNTVNLSGGIVNGIIYGGFNTSGIVSGNTLNVQGYQGSVGSLAGFDQYNFLLPSTLGSGATQIHITGSAVDLSGTGVAITGLHEGGPDLHVGDTLTLIDNTTNAPTTFSGANIRKGISLRYDFERVQSPNALMVRLLNVTVNPQIKALSEGQLAAVAFVGQGADRIADVTRSLTLDNQRRGVIPFGNMSAGGSRYNTGSHVNVGGLSLLGGVAHPMEVGNNLWLLGAFVESGWGNYNSHNSFNNAASVAGNGNTSYYGGGLLSRYDLANGIYFDNALRVGQVNTSFSSDNLCDATGGCARYNTSSLYYGAQAGLGYLLAIDGGSTLDLSSRYLWTHQNSNSVTAVNDPVHFAAIDSQRWRNALRFNYLTHASISPYVGIAYEHEFDGQANAKAYSIYKIDAPALRGGTGIGELGINVLRNNCRPNCDMKLNVGVQAYAGRRQGVDGVISFVYVPTH